MKSKKEVEVTESNDVNVISNIDDSFNIPVEPIEKPEPQEEKKVTTKAKSKDDDNIEYINCLRNEIVTVRKVPKANDWIKDPKHVAYNGMFEGCSRTFVVPKLKNGLYCNVLTNDEIRFLEHVMGFNHEDDVFSIYKKPEVNYWSTANPNFSAQVELDKNDSYLDLSVPVDYIKYKILLANKDLVCPSLEELEERPKLTYQYVLIRKKEEAEKAINEFSTEEEVILTLGAIKNDKDKLKVIIETIENKPIAKTAGIGELLKLAHKIAKQKPKTFLNVAKDKLLDTKVVIDKAIDKGVIIRRGNFYYLKNGNLPLCNAGEDPTLFNAAKFLNEPKNQETLFGIEAQIKE